ncbi:MAG TPA: AMP-binding protein [Acetobacteraceae bacterium]|jgi:acyl-coenzyme A synthetase/AMP-(fatty) acid ligase|nr:AMP-binding protein [Acetobacteraceae bacterium]
MTPDIPEHAWPEHAWPAHARPEHAWRRGPGALDARLLDVPMLETVRAMAGRTPDALAIAEPGRSVTYAQLWRAIGERVAGLASVSEPGGTVGVIEPYGLEYCLCVLACMAAGRICVPLDPAAPAQRLAELARAVRMQAGFGPADALPAGCRPVPAGAHPAPTIRVDVRGPAFIVATSGSSGQPKLVVQNQRTWAFHARGFVDLFGLTARDRHVFAGAPNSFSAVIHVVTPLLVGGAVLACDLRTHGLSRLLELMTQHGATVLRIAPTLARTVMRPAARAAFASLHGVRLVGEAVSAADVAALRPLLPAGAMVASCYGATETIPFEYVVPADFPADSATMPCGHLRPGGTFAILDDDGCPCPDGVAGELVIRSRYNAMGEWRDGGFVRGRMLPDPADPEATMYRTGDVALVQPDGLLTVLGRIDRQVKVNSNRVDLVEVEAEIRALADITDAAVLAREVAERVEIVAFVVGGAAAAEIRRSLADRLPGYMLPARIVHVGRIPLLPGGKTDWRSLMRSLDE